MSHRFRWMGNGSRNGPEPAGDPQLSSVLATLDPGAHDSAYWIRFRSSVVAGAAGELARRRRSEATVGDLVLSWSRALVPAAMLAAAAAAFLLFKPAPQSLVPLSVEELLSEGIAGALEEQSPDVEVDISFTSEVF